METKILYCSGCSLKTEHKLIEKQEFQTKWSCKVCYFFQWNHTKRQLDLFRKQDEQAKE